MKKVLILTYYWPPSGGAGVQRWLKFAKYLREYGYEPIIYTALDAEYPVLDDSLQKDIPHGLEVLRRPIREPYSIYRQFLGKKKEERTYNVFIADDKKQDWKHKLALYIRANYFIPDARFLWIKPSARFLKDYLKTHRIDLIASTGPPHSMHLIAAKLKAKTGIPWLADFRDPWTTIDFVDDMPFSKKALKKNEKLEKAVLNSADHITVVSDLMKEEFESKTLKPVSLITNGFDHEDFENINIVKSADTFTIIHTGSLNNRRNHPAVWEAIAQLRTEHPDLTNKLRIKLIGKTDAEALEDIKAAGLESISEFIDYMSHADVVVEQLKADVLLLMVNRFGATDSGFKSGKGTVTGKLFEYLACKKPILAAGIPDSQINEILTETGSGKVCHYDDVEGMKTFILKCLNEPVQNADNPKIMQYSRKNLTGKMAELFDKLTENKS